MFEAALGAPSELKTIPSVCQYRPSDRFFLSCIATAITMTCTSHRRQLSVCCCRAGPPARHKGGPPCCILQPTATRSQLCVKMAMVGMLLPLGCQATVF